MRSHHSNFLFLFFLYNTKRSLCTVYTFSIFFVLATSFDICTYVALDDKACSSQHLLDCCHSYQLPESGEVVWDDFWCVVPVECPTFRGNGTGFRSEYEI